MRFSCLSPKLDNSASITFKPWIEHNVANQDTHFREKRREEREKKLARPNATPGRVI